MTQLNIADVEDSYLNADLFDEWKVEFEKKFYEPISNIVLADLASKMTDAEMEELKQQDPESWKDLMAVKEKMDKFNERKMKEAKRNGG